MDATAARRAMAVLRTLAAAPGPMPAAALARELGIPRSSIYHLLTVMAQDGFVVHFPDDHRWGLGVSAFELGSAYARHDPLQRLAGPVLRQLVRWLPANLAGVAHCAVLHGRETFYVATASVPRSAAIGAVPIVADVGVRLPASLTASGRAMLALLPAAQVRALFPSASSFVDRTGRGPMTPSALARILATERRAGASIEEGMITHGYSSIAVCAHDRAGRPAASLGITMPTERIAPERAAVIADVLRRAAGELSRHLGATDPPA